MSNDFEIISWDGIISTNSTPLASVTFKPNKEFIQQFLQNTNNKLQIKISGTDSKYDNYWMALIDTSATTPNCRPNFYDATNYWIATLIGSSWQGVPTSFGKLSIVNGPYQIYKKDIVKSNISSNPSSQSIIASCNDNLKIDSSNTEYKTNNNLLIWSSAGLILLSIILLLIFINRK